MKIQIIGLGIVGTAQACLSQKLGHDVVGYDIRPVKNSYCRVNENMVDDVDITFICANESATEDIVGHLVDIEHRGIIAIKSTVPVGATQQLSRRFGIHICHNPEFLREKYYLEDIYNPNMIIIGGCCPEHNNILKEFYQPLQKPIIIVDPTTSELSKLALNGHLSVLITFWNEINELCCKLNIDIRDISNIVAHDPRISSYGTDFFGSPYGGKCLPKDIIHLIETFHSHDINPKFFESCENFNKSLIKKGRVARSDNDI